MNTPEQIRKLTIDDAHTKADADYIDENIALHMNIKDIPIDNGAMRLDMYVILACIRGRMKLDIDCLPYTITGNDVLMCLPNRLVNNCLLSPDFEGMVLCISHRALQELANENVLWERGLEVMNRPLVHISDDSAHDLLVYSRALYTAIHSSSRVFRRQIIMSLVRACLYELMSNVNLSASESQSNLTQKDYLFRSFIELLTSLDVKPRYVQWYAASISGCCPPHTGSSSAGTTSIEEGSVHLSTPHRSGEYVSLRNLGKKRNKNSLPACFFLPFAYICHCINKH
ncbi:MAG: hypothetical protein ACI37U_06740 [Bacteroides sp.]